MVVLVIRSKGTTLRRIKATVVLVSVDGAVAEVDITKGPLPEAMEVGMVVNLPTDSPDTDSLRTEGHLEVVMEVVDMLPSSLRTQLQLLPRSMGWAPEASWPWELGPDCLAVSPSPK